MREAQGPTHFRLDDACLSCGCQVIVLYPKAVRRSRIRATVEGEAQQRAPRARRQLDDAVGVQALQSLGERQSIERCGEVERLVRGELHPEIPEGERNPRRLFDDDAPLSSRQSRLSLLEHQAGVGLVQWRDAVLWQT
ncbi:hypothetical protein [Microbacterium aoyamense]|uniref:hypothetical protein n=1 Tax=Microbacterium aoyamense TaxID=344166 RepID=UPI0020041DBA|nr:hypothetical protein [Microbacterium aoyamense]